MPHVSRYHTHGYRISKVAFADRFPAATLMTESGADVITLGLYLGHGKITTKQIYTHVTIQRLKEVHAKTHPAQPDKPATDPPQAPDEPTTPPLADSG